MKPYLCSSGYWEGAWKRWRFIGATIVSTYVVSNGCEKAVASLPWPNLAALAPEIGISWKGAVVSTIVIALATGAQHIADGQRPHFD